MTTKIKTKADEDEDEECILGDKRADVLNRGSKSSSALMIIMTNTTSSQSVFLSGLEMAQLLAPLVA
ncbi:MAG: hypothetical protein MHMPM18_001881 [Marteilia pararefringens]